MFKKPGYPKLEFEGDRRILPTCVISTLEAKRLLHKGCEAYLAHVVDKSTPKINFGQYACSVRIFGRISRIFIEFASK